MKWSEAESDHECSCDRNRGAESCCTFNERTEAEGDKQYLKPAIASDPGDRFLHDLELTGFDRDVVEKDRR